MNTKRILRRTLPAAAATALLCALAPASYAAAPASQAVSTPQICLAGTASVHPARCEGHAPPGIYWYQGLDFDGSYLYLNLTYGCTLNYSTYQGDYVVVPAGD